MQRHLLCLRTAAITAGLLFAAGCGTLELSPVADPSLKATVHAVTADAELITFAAAQPGRIIERRPLAGLPSGERLVGIDYRVARGELYALSATGRLYRIDPGNGKLAPVAKAGAVTLPAGSVAFDFNPVADRIRVVGADGTNLRLHPDTGALAATDPKVQYDTSDSAHGQMPRLSGAAYTYNKKDEKLTTNYAIDLARGTLVTQGSIEGMAPAVSPNTGKLFTVGALSTGPVDEVAFDIADIDNTALAALTRGGLTSLYVIDLKTGRGRNVGTIGTGRPLWGMAIAP